MKRFLTPALLFVFCLGLVGCGEKVEQRLDQKTVIGTVTSLQYSPSERKYVYGYHYSFMKGKMKWGWHWKTIPAKGSTKVEAPEVTFASDTAEWAKRVQDAGLKVGDSALLVYQEVYDLLPDENNPAEKVAKFVKNELLAIQALPEK